MAVTFPCVAWVPRRVKDHSLMRRLRRRNQELDGHNQIIGGKTGGSHHFGEGRAAA